MARVKEQGLKKQQTKKTKKTSFGIVPGVIALETEATNGIYPVTAGIHGVAKIQKRHETDTYTEQLIDYLHTVNDYFQRNVEPHEQVSFKLNEEGITTYTEACNTLDVLLEEEPLVVQGHFEHILRERKKLLERTENQVGRTNDFWYITLQPNNTLEIEGTFQEQEGTYLVTDTPMIKPICGPEAPIGARVGRTNRNNGVTDFVWETHGTPNEFLTYLKQVHEAITGATYRNLSENGPLIIHPRGTNPERRAEIEETIQKINRRYEGKTTLSKFAHAIAKREGEVFHATHFDGSVLEFPYDTLRKRLFNINDPQGRVGEEHYTKIFRFDTQAKPEEKKFFLPLYTREGIEGPFDLHDIVDLYMGRITL